MIIEIKKINQFSWNIQNTGDKELPMTNSDCLPLLVSPKPLNQPTGKDIVLCAVGPDDKSLIVHLHRWILYEWENKADRQTHTHTRERESQTFDPHVCFVTRWTESSFRVGESSSSGFWCEKVRESPATTHTCCSSADAQIKPQLLSGNPQHWSSNKAWIWMDLSFFFF